MIASVAESWRGVPLAHANAPGVRTPAAEVVDEAGAPLRAGLRKPDGLLLAAGASRRATVPTGDVRRATVGDRARAVGSGPP